MTKLFLIIGSISGALSVIIGAMGGHKYAKLLESYGRTETFDTAFKYHIFHTVAILIVGLLAFKVENKWLYASGFCFLGGILTFSASLYILSLSNVTEWGRLTPVGGVLFISGWILLAVSIFKSSI